MNRKKIKEKIIEFLDLEKWVEFLDEYFMPILVFLEVFCFILWLIVVLVYFYGHILDKTIKL